MLYFDRIDKNEVTDLGKSNNSKECMISEYWFFLIMDSNFKIMYAMVVMV